MKPVRWTEIKTGKETEWWITETIRCDVLWLTIDDPRGEGEKLRKRERVEIDILPDADGLVCRIDKHLGVRVRAIRQSAARRVDVVDADSVSGPHAHALSV